MVQIISSLFFIIFFQHNLKSNAVFQVKTRTNDSLFLKALKYEELNKFVRYHILDNGKSAGSSNLLYTIKPIAVYHYSGHYGNRRYEEIKDGKPIYCGSKDIKNFILSDKFASRVGFDGLFKINSKISVIYKPYLLKRLTVFPKSNNVRNVNLLMIKLKREGFVSKLALDTLKPTSIDTLFHSSEKNIYVRIELKPEYRDLENIKDITEQLKKWPDINGKLSMTVVDLFTGYSEQDMIFRITSEKSKPK